MTDCLFDTDEGAGNHRLEDTLFLTVNSRLSRHLLATFEKKQLSESAWQTPTILPLTAWLNQQFHLTNDDGAILLSDFQEACLWEMIIKASDQHSELLQPTQTAQLIKQAWRFLIEWQVPLDALAEFESQVEVQSLLQWITVFKQHCIENNWVTNAELPSILFNKKCFLPTKICLVGFDDFNPALNKLLDRMREYSFIECVSSGAHDSNAQKILLADMDDELHSMAHWAKQQWENNAEAKIACIVPDLETQRSQVHRVFTQVFCAENMLPSHNASPAPFNISAGQSLDKHDMIKTALLLLRWSSYALPIQDCCYLLQSPYLSLTEVEQNLGAQMDAKLRENNQRTVTPDDLFEVLSGFQASYPNTTWLSRWRDFIAVRDNDCNNKQPSQWAQHFCELLKVLNWPGQHTQQSVAFQYLERFKKLLLTYSQLDLLYQDISLFEAIALLSNLTKQTIFQPKSHDEPIQIMGVLEASGLSFDGAWIMGLHNGVWPPPTKPNPFIPFSIQQAYQMPHATAARELQYCEQVTERLKHCAKTVIFSTPASQGDQELHPTCFIADLPVIDKQTLSLIAPTETINNLSNNVLECFSDAIAPRVESPSDIRGGSYILKLQATCPFRAFSTIRLKATPLEMPHIGLDSPTRGNLVHQILYLLWGEIKDQLTLSQLTAKALAALIDSAIDASIQPYLSKQHKLKNAYFWQIEKLRLKTIITQWMQFESNRPFFRVSQRETTTHIKLNELPLTLRIDRVDELADGSHILIDYKTGMTSINHWFSPRLSEPQLPLYAAFTLTTMGLSYQGLAYGEVRAGNFSYKGLVSESHIYAESPTPGFDPIHRTKNGLMIYQWEMLKTHWKNTLEKLAMDFCEGVATVDPINAQACQFCALESLCRISAK